MEHLIIADVRSLNRNGKSTGHYFTLAENYLNMFIGKCKIEIAGGPIYKTKFDGFMQLKYDTYVNENIIKTKYKVIHNCFELFHKAQNDIIILQCNAVATVFFALMLYYKPLNIYMIQYNTFSIDSTLKRFIYRVIKNKLKGILCPNDEIGRAYGVPYCVVPDYCVTQKEYSCLPKELTGKKYDYGIVGIITRDKGTVEVAKKLVNSDCSAIIAGRPVDNDIKQELLNVCSKSSNITLVLGYISDEDYDKYIRQSKYCILNYSDAYSKHSSGVVFDTIYRGTPVVGRKCRSLDFIEDNGLGIVYEDIDSCDFKEIVNRNADEAYLNNIREFMRRQLAASGEILDFVKERNHENNI
ncbi:hypothetical protein [Clostridium sp. AWRP]|uniref:hypothetical protein n=1 Tax=Clostridium sp. AWRP TaxID=2212991 RepID=UPI000FD89A67|nr:hypothetical protein [Clostridium sp. AWRP]AZV55532.1 hypothetical protein DMR38_02325 [Clostridium sp. AWRP]